MLMKLLLLPGMDGTGELFSDLRDALSGGFSSIVIKYPPNKKLSFYELAKLVQKHFPTDEEFIIVAESFSVPVAIMCAVESPINLKALVLSAGFIVNSIKGLNRYIVWILIPIFLRLPLPKSLLKIWLIGGNANSILSSKVKTIVSSVQKSVLIDRLKSILKCDVRKEIGEIKIPILYIRAKNDRLIDKSCYEKIKAANSNVELLELDGPHFILQKEPTKSAKIIMKFIDDVYAINDIR